MSGIHFEATYGDSKLDAGLARSNQKISDWSRKAVNSGESVDDMFNRVRNSVAALASLEFARRIGGQIIQVRGEFQQLGIALETILQSKVKADELMAQVVDLASTTPFQLTEVAQGTKQLLAYGFASENVISNLRMLGDIASGVSAPIGDLVYLYGTLQTQGRAYTRDIMQFTSRGIPVVDELAKVMGVAKSEVQGLVEAGKIGFPEVEKAFQNLTKEGGKFFNLMEKQSASITGQISNLQDNIDKMFNSIGQSNEGFIYGAIAGLNNLVENYETILGILKTLAVAYGTYKAAVIAVSVYESVASKNEAIRVSIIEAKVAAIKQVIAEEEKQAAVEAAAAASKQALASAEAKIEATRQSALARTTAAKEAAAAANAELIAAERAYAITVAQTNEAYLAGALTTKQAADLKKELAVVEKARVAASKANAEVEKAITSETVINANLEAKAVAKSEAEKVAAKKAGIEADRERAIASQTATAAEVRAARAQQFLNKTMLGNPYVLAALGLTTLVLAFTSFNKESEAAGKAFSDFKKNLKETTDEIDKNFKKLNETKEGTDQRRKSIEDINSKYGEYLTNLLDEKSSLEDIKKAQDEATSALAKNVAFKAQQDAIQDTKKAADEAANDFYSLIDGLSSKLSNEQAGKFKAAVDSYIESLKKSYDETGKFQSISAENIRSIYELSGGELTLLNSGKIQNAQYAAQDLVRSQSDVEKSTKNLEEQYNSYLEALGLTGKKTTEAKTALETIDQQIAATQKALKTAESDLSKLRAPDSTSSTEDIKKQMDLVDELKKKLELLTGVKIKAVDEVKSIKEEIDRLYDELEKADNKDQSAIAFRILALQHELATREKITEEYLKYVRGGSNSPKLPTLNGKVSLTVADKQNSGSNGMIQEWISAFGDLDKISTEQLKSLRDKLQQYISDVPASIPKDELKDLVETFEKLDREISDRNPFASLSKSVGDFKFEDNKLKALKEQLEYYEEQGASLEVIARIEDQIKKTESDRAKALGNLNKDINAAGVKGQQAVAAASSAVNMLENLGVKVSDNTKNVIDGLGQSFDALAEIDITKPFSIVKSMFNFVGGIGKSITAVFAGGRKLISEETFAQYDRLISTIGEVINKQKELFDTLSGTDATEAYETSIRLLQKQVDAAAEIGIAYMNSGASAGSHSYGYRVADYLKDYQKELAAVGVDLNSLGGRATGLFDLSPDQLQTIKEEIPELWANLDEKVKGYLQTIIDSSEATDELKQAMQEAVTGISFDSVKDGLDDLIKSTDTTWADVADSFEKHMQDSILSFVKNSYLNDALKQWYDNFTSYYKDGVLSEDEIAKSRAEYQAAYDKANDMYDAATQAAGVTNSATASGLSGQISRSITEDTASELAGLWNRTALDTRSILDYTKVGISHLVNIEANTYNSVVELRNAVTELRAIRSNTQTSGGR